MKAPSRIPARGLADGIGERVTRVTRREDNATRRVAHGRAAALAAALVLLFIALDFPVNALANDLWWGHTLQHLFLFAAAPILLDLFLLVAQAPAVTWSDSPGSPGASTP
ncbi:MAG: cytochrome c oxidase assembly protein [Chloroflexi bacterium]|nr:cytochrome c oxidase assembly protein [Chloroflexota bacterium]